MPSGRRLFLVASLLFLGSFVLLGAPRGAHAETPAPVAALADRGTDMRLGLVFGVGGSYYGEVDTGLELQIGKRYPGQRRAFLMGRLLFSEPIESGPADHVSLLAGGGVAQRLCYRDACLVVEARAGFMGVSAGDFLLVGSGRAGVELGGPRGLFGVYLGMGWRQALAEDDDHSGDSRASGAEGGISVGGGYRW